MKTLNVSTGRPYRILIEQGLVSNCGAYIKQVSKAQRAVIITDSNVAPLYGDTVADSLTGHGFSVSRFVFPAGEASKQLSTIERMYCHLAQQGITRKDLIIALGGGVTGDMAGFAAATYLRGISFVQIPTSLLAQVDSSVGGKTGVDLPFGKNLVGAFWQPDLVLIDPDTLSTLPQRYINDGMAEVIKYGCIKSLELFETLETSNALDHIGDIIYNCTAIKRDVVSRDEREAGERMLLNFGHTLGHALEKHYNYTALSHGEAVAIGMVMITKAAEQANLTPAGTAKRIEALCLKYNLPVSNAAPYGAIAQAAKNDKKTSACNISLVLLKQLGDSFVHTVSLNELETFITV